jgi:hypothetical protein
MKTSYSFALGILLLSGLLAACNPLKPLQSQDAWTNFNDTFKVYSKNLRWSHFRETAAFITPQHQAASQALLPSLKNRRVSKVTPTSWIMNKEEDGITGLIEINYYVTDRNVVRQMTQKQSWVLLNGNWLLDTPLPDLR